MHNLKKYFVLLFPILILQWNLANSLFYGQQVEEGQFKYAVGLAKVNSACTLPFCTGVLITSQYVVTAGHCVYGRNKTQIEIVAGIVDWRDNLYAEYRYLDSIHLHPEFYPGIKDASYLTKCALIACECILGPSAWRLHSKNDIAVLILETALEMTDFIGVIDLPDRMTPPPYGTECIFAGWGDNELKNQPATLRWTTFKILNHAECRAKGETLRESELCVLAPDKKSYTGGGDSGGPLVCNDVLVGVLHIGSDYASYPTIFPIVSHHIDFIEEVMMTGRSQHPAILSGSHNNLT